MSALDGFYTTWNNARQTFGQGTPQPGTDFDKSPQLATLGAGLDAAAPGSKWSGAAATNYGTANTDHQKVFTQLAELDRKLAQQVDQSAQVVATGRQNLDQVRQWVTDAANSVPPGKQRDMFLMQIANKGLGQLTEVVQKTNAESNTVAQNIAKLGPEFDALTREQKFGNGEKDEKGDVDALGNEKEAEEESPSEQGEADSEALQNGELTPEQRERLVTNTTLTPEQQAALDNGNLTLPPEQMSYLQGYSRAFGDKTPAEVKAIMDKAGPDGSRVADVFQLASNENIKTGLPETQPPSIDGPASGGKHALPDGILKVLDGPAMTQPMSSGVFEDGRWVVPPEPTGPLQPTPGLNDLATIVQAGNRDLQEGTALDSGLMSKSQEILAQSNQWPIPHAPGPGVDPMQDGPRWYHENVDPTLQNMFNALNTDSTVIHESVTGHGAQEFLDDMTQHQWQDNGLAAGGLFDWVSADAANDPTGRAAETAHALAEYTSQFDNRLLNLPGTDNLSLGQVNPELTRDWSRAFAPYLDDMVGMNVSGNEARFPPLDGIDEQPLKTRALMSVMYSDPEASEVMFSSANSFTEQYIERAANSITDSDPTSDNAAMKMAGKLQGALDLGSFDEKHDLLGDARQAVQESYDRRSRLYDLFSGAVGETSTQGGFASLLSPYLKEAVIGAPPDPNAEEPTATPRSDFPIQARLAEALLAQQVGNPDIQQWLNEKLGDKEHFNIPPSKIDPDGYTEYYNKITSYFTGIFGADKLMDNYWETYSSAYLDAHGK
ncbi:EspA/EspE family type VII secretion system effector [Mycolicibacterium litorale]|uniref:TPR repeat region-containing protein n=1 Tax=Mycolicibacterium litorale TaxID=758802 RepID=UPI0016274CEB|nr:EspA/EspE family type VII secretion system effector [Mycolicibacterium litorale]